MIIDKKSLKFTFFRYVVLWLVGFCVYITIEVLFRGYSFPLMGVVGGIDFLLIGIINNKISWDIDLSIQAIIGSFIITMSELIVGTIDRMYLHYNMWDYSNLIFNYKGIICLEFSIIWIFISVLGIFVDDSINYYVFREEPLPYYSLLGFKFEFPKFV